MRTWVGVGFQISILSVALAVAVSAGSASAATRQFPSTAPGRYVAMVSPTNGESFVTPLNLRFVAIGHDDNVFTNDPVPGKGTNAAKVEFFIDDTLIYEQVGADAEYHVFKGYVTNLNVAPGQHVIWARATYTNVTPTLFLDSPPFTITVRNPPGYAQTVDLTANVVLSGNQSYALAGTATGRVRLNGNGFRIITTGSGTSGSVSLKFVDVYGLGNPADPASPGIDVVTTGSAIIEDSVFDSSNPIELRLNGAAAASVRRNLFRSNMRMPIGQQPVSAEHRTGDHALGIVRRRQDVRRKLRGGRADLLRPREAMDDRLGGRRGVERRQQRPDRTARRVRV